MTIDPSDKTPKDDDFEVEVEGEEPEGEEEGAEDERLSADEREADAETGGSAEEQEERRERKRLTSKERRERRRFYQQQDQLRIQALQQEVDNLREMMQGVSSTVQARDKQGMQRELEAVTQRIRELEAAEARFVQEGDGAKMMAARQQREQALQYGQQLYNQLQQAPAPPQESLDALTAAHAKTFIERNTWWDPRGGDEYSKIALQIDAGVKRDGFDSRDPTYWEELEARLRRRLPDHLFAEEPKPRRNDGTFARTTPRGGPPVAAPASQGEKPVVSIPKELRQALEEAGVWGDKKLRNNAIREYMANSRKAR